jgi:hypothetical protein
MANIGAEQKNLLKSNFLDSLGSGQQMALDLTEVEAVMLEAATRFRVLALRRLKNKGKVDTGHMSEIEISQISQTKYGSYSITIGYEKSNPASEYYDFQNKGVKGIKSGMPNSPYKYRTLSVSKNMVNALMQWYLRHKSYIKNEDQRTKLSRVQKKSLKVGKVADQAKNLRKIAEATAKKIKKRGMPRIGFFDDNLDKVFNEDFRKKLAIAIGEDIVINIRQYFDGNNGSK